MPEYTVTTVEAVHADRLSRALRRQAVRLTELADRFTQLAALVSTAPPSRVKYSQIAHRAVHDLMWGMANLNTDTMVYDAAEADVAHAEGK